MSAQDTNQDYWGDLNGARGGFSKVDRVNRPNLLRLLQFKNGQPGNGCDSDFWDMQLMASLDDWSRLNYQNKLEPIYS